MLKSKGKCGGGPKKSDPKIVPVGPYKRSRPTPCPPGGRKYPKSGPKTVDVDRHKRSTP